MIQFHVHVRHRQGLGAKPPSPGCGEYSSTLLLQLIRCDTARSNYFVTDIRTQARFARLTENVCMCTGGVFFPIPVDGVMSPEANAVAPFKMRLLSLRRALAAACPGAVTDTEDYSPVRSGVPHLVRRLSPRHVLRRTHYYEPD